MAIDPTPPVSCKYGAPMGRHAGPANAQGKSQRYNLKGNAMAYFEQHGAMHWFLGRPPAPVLHIICDDCAESVVPFDRSKPEGRQHWNTGWKWAPYYGANCERCGKPT